MFILIVDYVTYALLFKKKINRKEINFNYWNLPYGMSINTHSISNELTTNRGWLQ